MAFQFTQSEIDTLNNALGISVPIEKANAIALVIDQKREALRLVQSNHGNLVNMLTYLQANGGSSAEITAVQNAIAALEGAWSGLGGR